MITFDRYTGISTLLRLHCNTCISGRLSILSFFGAFSDRNVQLFFYQLSLTRVMASCKSSFYNNGASFGILNHAGTYNAKNT